MDCNINKPKRLGLYCVLILLGLYLACFALFYPVYLDAVDNINVNRLYVCDISSNIGYKEELLKYMTTEDIDTRAYDKVSLHANTTNFIEWLITGKLDLEITSIEENTETLVLYDVTILNEVANGRIYYNIDGTRFLAKDETYIATDSPTQICIRYAKSQKTSSDIHDYTVYYQVPSQETKEE